MVLRGIPDLEQNCRQCQLVVTLEPCTPNLEPVNSGITVLFQLFLRIKHGFKTALIVSNAPRFQRDLKGQ